MLAYLAGNVGPSCGYVGLCWPHVDPCWAKRSEKWEQPKSTVKRRIFWWSASYLGAMLAHLGAMLAHLEGNVGPSWAYVGPSWGYLGPSWGYVGPSWRPCWPILRAMLARVGPSWATRSEKRPKMVRAQNTVKRGVFWQGGWSAAGGAAPLSYGEERTAVRLCHGQGAPGRTKGLPPLPPTPKSWAVCLIRPSSKTSPNCVPKPCSNFPQKLPNLPSEFLVEISFSVSCSCCLVAPSCKHQGSRTDPSPQQNST